MIVSLINRLRPWSILPRVNPSLAVFRLASSGKTDGEQQLTTTLAKRFPRARLIDVKDTSCKSIWSFSRSHLPSSSSHFQLVAAPVTKCSSSPMNSPICEQWTNIVWFRKRFDNSYRIFTLFEYSLEQMKNNLSIHDLFYRSFLFVLRNRI